MSRIDTLREEGLAAIAAAADLSALDDLRGWFDSFWDDGLPRLKALAEKEPHP